MSVTDRSPWRRFLAVALPVFRSEVRWLVLSRLGFIISCLLAVTGLNVWKNYVGGAFVNALSDRQPDRFWTMGGLYFGVFTLCTIVVVFKQYTEERLGLYWRRWLTTYLLTGYMSHRAYLRVNRREDIDNPDQRITDDIRTFTVTTLAFALILLNSTMALVAFVGVLWTIAPRLVLTAFLYAAFGSLMSILLGRRLVGLNFLQLKREADLRYRLIQVRENDEAIGFHASEAVEREHVLRRLAAVVENFKSIIRVNRNLNFFTNGYNYVTQILPMLVVAPLLFSGDLKLGGVTQSAEAFIVVLGAFSVIVTEFQRISSFAAVVGRLSSLREAIEAPPSATGPVIEVSTNDSHVACDNLTLWTPHQEQVLIRNLTLTVPRGQRLLVTGPNGTGKSALFRAAAGIWCWGSGKIIGPPGWNVMFLPNLPYTVPGTLRDQLLYALPNRTTSDAEIERVLAEVKLDHGVARVGGLDVERDWLSILSKGQLQRLGLARVLLANPKYAFLDGATSALDSFWVKTLYGVLRATDITYLTIGDHPDLVEYHDLTLELCGDGSYRVGPKPTGTCPVRPKGSTEQGVA